MIPGGPRDEDDNFDLRPRINPHPFDTFMFKFSIGEREGGIVEDKNFNQ